MKKLLLIKHGSLGDIISSTSVIYDIKKHYKNHKIFLLTTNSYKNFFEQSNLVNDIIIDNRKGLLSIIYIIKKILNINFEMIIDLQNSQRTSFYALLIYLFSNTNINGTSRFVTHRYKYFSKNMPSVIDGLSNQIEILGIKTSRKPYLDWLSNPPINIGELENRNFFLINPGCSKKNHQKLWAAKNYAKVCTYLISQKILPVVIGTNQDEDVINVIIDNENRVLNLINKSPLNFIFQLSKKALGAISNDTGPAHLISASGCKIHLVLSSFSDVKTVVPQGSNVSFTQKKNINDILTESIIEELKIIFKI